MRVAEWPSVWERAVHLVYRACLPWMFVSLRECCFTFRFWGYDMGFDCFSSWSLVFPLLWKRYGSKKSQTGVDILWCYSNKSQIIESGNISCKIGTHQSQIRNDNILSGRRQNWKREKAKAEYILLSENTQIHKVTFIMTVESQSHLVGNIKL